MTAEVGILNRSAVALAADSAITTQLPTGKKISTSGNKLFALSYRHPVGVMIYNNSLLMEMPWETIVKTYRTTIPSTGFNSLAEYADSFIRYIESNSDLFPDEMCDRFMASFISPVFHDIRIEIDTAVGEYIKQFGPIDEAGIKHIVKTSIDKMDSNWRQAGLIGILNPDDCRPIVMGKRVVIGRCIQDNFGALPLEPACLEALVEIAVNLLAKGTRNQMNTGVVIAGFGEKEFLPSIINFQVDGLFGRKLNVFSRGTANVSDKMPGVLLPFAQTDMVELFMRGVDNSYLAAENKRLDKLKSDYSEKGSNAVNPIASQEEKTRLKTALSTLGEELIKEYTSNRDNFIMQQFMLPVYSVIGLLQKDQLAVLAESLVTLTSHKRQFSTQEETVKLPIDVAVITKGEGFIWIQRKHYFKPEINPQYFTKF